MKWRIVYLVLLLSQSVIIMGAPDPRLFDIRVATMADLRRTGSVVEFSQEGVEGYNSVEAYWKDESVYVSAKNNVLKLSYTNGLRRLDGYNWHPDPRDVAPCVKKGNPEEECKNNYIKILLLFNGTRRSSDAIFMCGTMAERPQCSERSTTNLATVIQLVGGMFRCPYSPRASVSAIMASDGYLYLGSTTDRNQRIFAILRRNQHRDLDRDRRHKDLPELKTYDDDHRLLMDPTFVSSHEIGDYVYFFFRETSFEELTSCKSSSRRVVVSRVARVCKADSGQPRRRLQNEKPRWTTFLKARIVCQPRYDEAAGDRVSSQVAGAEYPYDQITSTVVDSRERMLYATFTSSQFGPAGSALCRYRLADLDKVFLSKYKVQTARSINEWILEANKGVIACPKPGETKQEHNLRSLSSSKYHLVSGQLRPPSSERYAAFVRNGERWTRVLKTSASTPRRPYTVVFVASDAGHILKLVKIRSSFCLVEILRLEAGDPVQDMALVSARTVGRARQYIIATTRRRVLRLELHRCRRWRTRDLCLGSKDPFCAWDRTRSRCVALEEVRRGRVGGRLEQNLNDCPPPPGRQRVDGAWSQWGAWTECGQAGAERPELTCLCRRRACDSPPSLGGGRPCTGRALEVTNCTVDGGWTSWTAWSSCGHTCGTAYRWRIRYCESPRPQRGGRKCSGKRREEQKCAGTPPCPAPTPPPVHGSWSSWSEWSVCTQPCNTGFRRRSRTCTEPAPLHGGNPCLGNSWEYSKCNDMECADVRKMSPWTPWTVEKGGLRMVRNRHRCSAPVPDMRQLELGTLKEHRRCFGSDGCVQPDSSAARTSRPPLHGRKDPNSVGGWNQWSPWSKCTRTCGSGRQERRRTCKPESLPGHEPVCLEEDFQNRMCNLGPCPIGEWSCWSHWSACTCDKKTRARQRECRSRDGSVSFTCPGTSAEEASCDNANCYPDGWGPWSMWSMCRSRRQLRKRECRRPVTEVGTKSRYCQGPMEEQKDCQTDTGNVQQSIFGDGPRFHIYHVIVVGIATFLLGCTATAVVMYCCCWRPALGKRSRRYRDPSPILLPDLDSGPALAGTVPGPTVGPPAFPPGTHGGYLEDASLLSALSPWAHTRARPGLDRQHSFHGPGSGPTGLGRQYSAASSSGVYTHASTSVRGGRLDPWSLTGDSDALAYTTFRRPGPPRGLPARPGAEEEDVGPEGVPRWAPTRSRTRSQGDPTAALMSVRHPLDSEQDSVFGRGESRHLLHSPYSEA